MRLPPELCEAIVDQIPAEDWLTLQNCALVCRFFALRAQKILFKKITLVRPIKTLNFNTVYLRQPTRRFLSVINSSPRLGGYVEEVEITDNAHLNFYREELSWIRRDTTLPVILYKLDKIQRLSISGNVTGNRLNFRAWDEDLKHTILMKFQSPLLTGISLSFVRNIPVSIFTNAPALESVNLFKSVFIVDGALSPARRASRPKLKTLELTMTTHYEWTSFYPWLMDEENSLDLTDLIALALHVDAPEGLPDDPMPFVSAVAWLVRRCSATLRHLRLFYPPEASSSLMAPDAFLDMRTLPNLRTLSLHGSLWTDTMAREPSDRLPWLVAVLRQIPAAAPLERISLLCSVEQQDHHPIAPRDVGDAGWAGFAEVVGRLAETVEVYVLVSLFESCVPTTKAVVEERLRGLCERGIVHVRQVALNDADVFE